MPHRMGEIDGPGKLHAIQMLYRPSATASTARTVADGPVPRGPAGAAGQRPPVMRSTAPVV